jgi:hypothetical protein
MFGLSELEAPVKDGEISTIAKAAQSAIDAAGRLGSFFDKVFGSALAETVGTYWTDPVAARRLEARIASYERLSLLAHDTRRRLESLGVDPVRIPEPKVLLPLLEEATLEEHRDLQKLWANLLAAATSAEEPVNREFVSILADLSPVSALALRDYFATWRSVDRTPFQADGLVYGPGMDGDNFGYDVTRSLVRLGLLEPAWIEFQTYEPEGHDDRFGYYAESRESIRVLGDLTAVAMTGYGEAFCKALGVEAEGPNRVRTSHDLRRWAKQSPWRG